MNYNLLYRCDSLRECGDLGCYVHPLFPIYVYGCFCSPGHVLQPGTNECIPVAQCDAVQDGVSKGMTVISKVAMFTDCSLTLWKDYKESIKSNYTTGHDLSQRRMPAHFIIHNGRENLQKVL